MKRKIDFTTMKNQKIMRKDVSSLNISESSFGSRNFDFKLTDKKAKSNFKNAALRKPFEIERKQRCCNLKFSAGAFLHAVKPSLEIWNQIHKNEDTHVENDLSISVVDLLIGEDQNGKQMDSKVTFLVNKSKVVVHVYNSTCNVKVEGSIYHTFIQKYLEPLFSQLAVEKQIDIANSDQEIAKVLGNKVTCVRSTIKSVGSNKRRSSSPTEALLCEDITIDESINGDVEACRKNLALELMPLSNEFICDICDFKAETSNSLNDHISLKHSENGCLLYTSDAADE